MNKVELLTDGEDIRILQDSVVPRSAGIPGSKVVAGICVGEKNAISIMKLGVAKDMARIRSMETYLPRLGHPTAATAAIIPMVIVFFAAFERDRLWSRNDGNELRELAGGW